MADGHPLPVRLVTLDRRRGVSVCRPIMWDWTWRLEAAELGSQQAQVLGGEAVSGQPAADPAVS